MPADRVFAGDDEQYFPDYGRWLKPGDLIPDEWPDDPRFVPAASSPKSRTAVKPADNEE